MQSGRGIRIKPLAAMIAATLSPIALAQGVATERELTPVTVTGTRSPLDPNLPASTYSMTSEDFDRLNIVNTQDALRYAPDTVVRRLKMSDRSGGIAGRSFGVGQPERVLAYVDGMLISNYLASHQVPKWGIVTPDEVARVDVLYGPFSAIYPGNSIGTTIAYTTKVPEKLEASSKVLAYEQKQSNYGFNQNFGGNEESAYVGNRWGDLSLSFAFNHTKSQCQGTGYATQLVSSGTGAAGTAVTGAVADRDVSGNARYMFGTSSMESTDQNLAKIKLAYDFTPTLTGDVTYARWRNDYSTRSDSRLRDAAGNTVWSGNVVVDGKTYSLASSGVSLFGVTEGIEDNEQIGVRLRTRNKTGWNYSVQASSFELVTDDKRASNADQSLAGGAGAGVNTVGTGTGWRTFEVQSTYTPDKDGKHALTFGYHQNQYTLKNQVFDLSNWHFNTTRTAETQNYYGKTEIQALYAQDAWRFLPKWTATAGLRYEKFHAWDGSQYNKAATTTPSVSYEERNKSAFSPKLSLAHELNDQWLARASVGRGVRFPTVAELFLGTKSGTSIVQNDPNLKPEVNDAKEISLLREVGENSLRLSLFEDDVKDAIYSQINVLSGSTTKTTQNIQRVRTRGVEAAFQGTNVGISGFDLTASAALLNAKILENPTFPTSEGKTWAGVPKFRTSLLGSYRSGLWLGSLGVRHEGRRYSTIDNTDTNPATYGGSNSYTVADARVAYSLGKSGSVALGVNNLTDKQYYDFHPYAGRTAFVELNLKY